MMIRITGLVIPAGWDNNGNVVDLAIATRDEEEYLISGKDQVDRLKSLLRQEVEIKGILQTKEGKKLFKSKDSASSKLNPTKTKFSLNAALTCCTMDHGGMQNGKKHEKSLFRNFRRLSGRLSVRNRGGRL